MIDQEKIKTKIAIIKECVDELEKMRGLSLEHFSSNIRDLAAAKYFLRTAIEAMIDIGSHMVAKLLLGVPNTNVEVMDLLAKKDIISSNNLPIYIKMVKYRNRLTHFYSDITVSEIHTIIHSQLTDFNMFLKEILNYISKS